MTSSDAVPPAASVIATSDPRKRRPFYANLWVQVIAAMVFAIFSAISTQKKRSP